HPDLHSFPTRRSSDLNRVVSPVNGRVRHNTASEDNSEASPYANLQLGRLHCGGPRIRVHFIHAARRSARWLLRKRRFRRVRRRRSEEHTSELQSRENL